MLILVIAGSGCGSGGSVSGSFSAVMNLYDIEMGEGGFAMYGILLETSGASVAAAGDVNGDGLHDILIGVPYSSSEFPQAFSGRAYVVFGKPDNAPVQLIDIEGGVGGFPIIGDGIQTVGSSVSGAGDFNNDGLDDVVLGARYATQDGGRAYVIFGKADTGAVTVSDSEVTGSGGYASQGTNGLFFTSEFGSRASSAGDFNGDGFDDVIVGAYNENVGFRANAGVSYILLGQASARSGIESGTNRGSAPIQFSVRGIRAGDNSGQAVSGAGDVNGDGFDDVIVGAPLADPNGWVSAGESYVVFGRSSTSTISLTEIANGSQGFMIRGAIPFEQSGWSVSGAGDVNNDGLDDVIVGAPYSDSNGIIESGAAYVVFGKTDTSVINLATIQSDEAGFAIFGLRIWSLLGTSVATAGDINGDGFDDVIVGAPGRLFSEEQDGSGTAYIVYGKADHAPVDLTEIEAGIGGFAMRGGNQLDQAGSSVSGGADFNGDGFFDVIVGAPGVGPGSSGGGGATYMISNPFAPSPDSRMN